MTSRKPQWVVDKEKARRSAGAEPLWLFGLHAVEAALLNPARQHSRLVLTQNALKRIQSAVETSGIEPEIADPSKFPAPIERGSVHQGAALEVRPLSWPTLDKIIGPAGDAPVIMALDRVSDPQNAGAILRSAEVFGAAAVIAPMRHSVAETGALAKAASGAVERQPYVRVKNLGNTLEELKKSGFHVVGLDGESEIDLGPAMQSAPGPLVLVMGAEGPGLRARTRSLCDTLARIPAARGFGSLNVSNAAAVALYAASQR